MDINFEERFTEIMDNLDEMDIYDLREELEILVENIIRYKLLMDK